MKDNAELAIKALFVFGAVWAAVISAALLFGGLGLISWSVYAHPLQFATVFPIVLKGLELIFLSPLILLSFVTIFRSTQIWVKWLRTLEGQNADDQAAIQLQAATMIGTGRLKVMIERLMTALLLTDMISRVFSGSEISSTSFLLEALACSLCLAFYLITSKH